MAKMCRTFEAGSGEHRSLAGAVRQHRKALTAPQLSELLACSVKSIYAMVAAGRIPAIRIGSMIRFDPHITAAWLEEREQAA